MKRNKLKNKTIKKNKKILIKKNKNNHPYNIGQNVFIRTVTHFFTGKLIEVYENELVLENASWIAETDRFYNTLKDGINKEIEPIPGRAIIGRNAIIDCLEWHHPLPTEQK